MTDKKINPLAPIDIYPDDPLWHEGCDRFLESWAQLFLEKEAEDEQRTLARFVDEGYTTMFSTPQGKHFIQGWTGYLSGDEPAYLPKFVPDVKYLVKDPKEPYRRHPSVGSWGGRQVGPNNPLRTRVNIVTFSLFPFRNTVPQVSFTHPDRGYSMWSPTQTYYEPQEESVLHNIMLEGHLKAIQQSHCPIWGKY